jgi:hypothetical protein
VVLAQRSKALNGFSGLLKLENLKKKTITSGAEVFCGKEDFNISKIY